MVLVQIMCMLIVLYCGSWYIAFVAIHLVGWSQMRLHIYVCCIYMCACDICVWIPLMMGSMCSFFTKCFFSSSCHHFYTHFKSVFKLPFDWKPRIIHYWSNCLSIFFVQISPSNSILKKFEKKNTPKREWNVNIGK